MKSNIARLDPLIILSGLNGFVISAGEPESVLTVIEKDIWNK